jgi:hypothetical protein
LLFLGILGILVFGYALVAIKAGAIEKWIITIALPLASAVVARLGGCLLWLTYRRNRFSITLSA